MKKRILVTLFEIMDYGGIIQHTEQLIAGLQELGHEVDFLILRWRDPDSVRPPKTFEDMAMPGKEGWLPSFTGGMVHQIHGWRGVRVMGYRGIRGIIAYQQLTKKYDLILHEVPCPTLNNSNDGNTEWPELFDVNTSQIAIVHDGNLEKLYPFFALVADECAGIACVHPAASESCRFIPVNRAIIMSSHPYPELREKSIRWIDRDRQWAAAHIWKRWKRMDDLVRAVPFMEKRTKKIVAGDGIEGRYMRSKFKCKEEYYTMHAGNRHYKNPVRIWDVAVRNGMKWLGAIPQPAVQELYRKSRLMIDPSWSRKYSELGSHFNRSMWDAVRNGAIPVAHEEHAEYKKVWSAGDTYLTLPLISSGPEEFAYQIEAYLDLDQRRAKRLVDNAMSTFYKYAERKAAARMYLLLAEGKNTGVDGIKKGKRDADFQARAKKMFLKFKGE